MSLKFTFLALNPLYGYKNYSTLEGSNLFENIQTIKSLNGQT